MRLCRYCERPVDKTSEKRGCDTCARCSAKHEKVIQFVAACDEFKRRINYDEILRKRKEEAEENDQGKTASV